MRYATLALLALIGLFASAPAYSHGGGTDAKGCHKETATNSYHCH